MKREQNTEKQTAEGPRTKKGSGEAEVLAKIAQMPAPYQAIGERLHEIIMHSAPGLTPRTWYGMPAYAKEGKVVCFFRVDKYMSFGLTEDAHLTREEGAAHQLMPSAWFLTGLDAATEAEIAAIVRRAAG